LRKRQKEGVIEGVTKLNRSKSDRWSEALMTTERGGGASFFTLTVEALHIERLMMFGHAIALIKFHEQLACIFSRRPHSWDARRPLAAQRSETYPNPEFLVVALRFITNTLRDLGHYSDRNYSTNISLEGHRRRQNPTNKHFPSKRVISRAAS